MPISEALWLRSAANLAAAFASLVLFAIIIYFPGQSRERILYFLLGRDWVGMSQIESSPEPRVAYLRRKPLRVSLRMGLGRRGHEIPCIDLLLVEFCRNHTENPK